jgi:hypothetical protein
MRRTTFVQEEPIVDHMITSHNTHIGLSHMREQELRRAVEHAPSTAASPRQVSEEAPTVSRLRRRLAQMHLAPAT